MESTINAANGEFVKKLRYVDDELRENPNASDKSLNGGPAAVSMPPSHVVCSTTTTLAPNRAA